MPSDDGQKTEQKGKKLEREELPSSQRGHHQSLSSYIQRRNAPKEQPPLQTSPPGRGVVCPAETLFYAQAPPLELCQYPRLGHHFHKVSGYRNMPGPYRQMTQETKSEGARGEREGIWPPKRGYTLFRDGESFSIIDPHNRSNPSFPRTQHRKPTPSPKNDEKHE